MSDLTTTADVKKWLNVTVNADDTVISALVTAVSKWVENYIGRQVASAAYTELRNGNAGHGIVPNQYPVTAVSSVKIDGVAVQPRSSFGSAGWYLANDTIYLDGGLRFTKGNANVELGYTGGYATVPEDLAQVTKQLVALRYREKDRIGQTSKSIQGETVSFDVKVLPSDVQNVLQNYKRVVWGA